MTNLAPVGTVWSSFVLAARMRASVYVGGNLSKEENAPPEELEENLPGLLPESPEEETGPEAKPDPEEDDLEGGEGSSYY